MESHPLFHLVPLSRTLAITSATAWTLASRRFTPDGCVALHRWARSLLKGLGIHVEVEGTPDLTAGLWVANHLSWLDPLVLLSLRPMVALAKGEVAAYPFIGPSCRKLRLAFVDRSDPVSRAGAVARLTHELRTGTPSLLFPEGTTTLGHHLAPLQEGGLRTAYRCGTTLQCFRLSSEDARYPWIGDDALVPHLGRLLRAPGIRIRLHAGTPLHPGAFASESAWIDAIRNQLTPIA
jgi:1-acyl-sn-glycerol-3-phosphate acyltransferase